MRYALMLALAVSGGSVAAQNSVLGVRGLGFPGRVSSAAARGMGGGSQIVDPLSALNPAAVALFVQATAGLTVTGDFRSYEIGATTATGLRETRFPVVIAGGRLSSRLGFGIAFSSYTERSWDLTATDTVMLRGAPVAVSDRLRSEGGIADVAGALAVRPIPQVALGLALHAITGSQRLDAFRTFADSAYRSYRDSAQTTHAAWGVGLGVIVAPWPALSVGVSLRLDGDLAADVDSVPLPDVPLPMTVAAGFAARPLPGLRLAATVIHRSWGAAEGALGATTAVFDTWEVGGGIALGGEIGPPMPIRLGVRWAELPFAPAGLAQARELDLAIGTGFEFAAGRGILDLALERVRRDGAGVTERAWQVTAGMTVRP